MFEPLIRDAEQRFHLGDKAGTFVGMLTGLVFNGPGGIEGLHERFAQQGLGDLYASWVGGAPGDNVLQPDQFAGIFGQDAVHTLATRLHLPNAAVTLAGAELLPRLIGLLTPNGRIPATMPTEAAALLEPSPRAYAQSHAYAAGAVGSVPARSRAGWLKWLLPLVVVILALLLMRRCYQPGPEPMPTMPAPSAQAPADTTPAAQAAPRFQFDNRAGQVSIGGQLASQIEKDRLLHALQASFAADRISGDIGVDPATLPAGWLDRLITALPGLKAEGLRFGLDGERLELDTSGLADEQRHAISEQMRGLFGGYEIRGLWDPAAAALAGLQPGFASEDLVKALNLMDIHFDTGSASITRDSQEILASAAAVIAQAPAGTRIEVGGHTDTTGDAAANLTLSQQRADAVVVRMGELGVADGVLTARGYGQEQPRADNASEDGRAQNRRIEFKVSQ